MIWHHGERYPHPLQRFASLALADGVSDSVRESAEMLVQREGGSVGMMYSTCLEWAVASDAWLELKFC